MKVFITRKEIENEYAITKVSDSLVVEFERIHKDKIVVEGSSIQDTMLKFIAMDKELDINFNPELKKVRQNRLR